MSKSKFVISLALLAGPSIGLPAQAFAQTPNFPIKNYQAVLGELSAFFTGDPNAPIGGLLDQHARWHHQGVPGGRTITPGQPGSGVEFLSFHRAFVASVYDAAGGQISDDFNQVTPWTQVPDALRALPSYPGAVQATEVRLLNFDPTFATEDDFGIYLEQNLHNWIHPAAQQAYGDTVIGDPHYSPRSTYFYQIHGLVNYLWSLYFPPNCQSASDFYGIDANVTFGFAPARVQTWWTQNNCGTSPISLNPPTTSCDKVSNLYNTRNGAWGAAPNDVQQWWIANGCNSTPSIDTDDCMAIRQTFGTSANVKWGAAPSEVRSVWTNDGCSGSPDPCELASDLYGIFAGSTWGSAPSDVRAFWVANNCNAGPRWITP